MHKTGIIHVHSTLSYDGRHSLEEIAALAKQRGYGFVGITEHSDTMDVAKMAHLVEECERLSDQNLKLIPGIEFTCENDLHLIGLGVEQYVDSKDPVWLAGFIRDHGGVSIIAHPSRYNYEIPVVLTKVIDGIEIWNANYDGRFIPNDQSIKLWQDRRLQNPKLVATGGQDLHVITGHVHVALTVECEDFTCAAILGAIQNGCFRISNSYCTVSMPSMNRSSQMAFGWARHAYLKAKTIRKWLLAGTR